MKEFIEKLIGRLEEYKNKFDELDAGYIHDEADEAIKIVNQLAEEYKYKYMSKEVLEQVMWERDVAIEQLKELGYEFGEKVGWIPCSERLPEEEGSYLVVGKTGGATVTRWYPPSQFYPNGHFGGNSAGYIRYWMPRPKAPIREEEG